MDSFGRFGPLLGVISVGNIYCKFLVIISKHDHIINTNKNCDYDCDIV